MLGVTLIEPYGNIVLLGKCWGIKRIVGGDQAILQRNSPYEFLDNAGGFVGSLSL